MVSKWLPTILNAFDSVQLSNNQTASRTKPPDKSV